MWFYRKCLLAIIAFQNHVLSYRRMNFRVLRLSHYLQIIRTVIALVFVYMMNYLILIKQSAYFIFSVHPMQRVESVRVSSRMHWACTTVQIPATFAYRQNLKHLSPNLFSSWDELPTAPPRNINGVRWRRTPPDNINLYNKESIVPICGSVTTFSLVHYYER